MAFVSDGEYSQNFNRKREIVDSIYKVRYGRHSLMERTIWDLGNQASKGLTEALMEVQVEVESVVNSILEAIRCPLLQHLDNQFTLQRKMIGSVAEGTKINHPDEFDFLVVLTPKRPNFIQLHSAEYKSTKLGFDPKSYCDVKVPIHQSWDSEFLSNGSLVSSKLFRFFLQEIKQYVNASRGNGFHCRVEQNGPAVTLYLNPSSSKVLVKLDLSLALQIDRGMIDACLRQNGSWLRLPDTVSWCDTFHVICSGDYWKLSVCYAELEYMKTLGSGSSLLYSALKKLGEMQSETHILEGAPMGSYPLKVAIMHHAEAIKAGKKDNELYINALEVLF